MNNSPLLFEEPPVFLGQTLVGSQKQQLYLPLSTVTSHTLVVSRSGGGKSHTLATLTMGLAKAAAVRRLNLLVAAFRQQRNLYPLSSWANNLVGVVESTPPISICVFDPHRDLVKRLFEDLTLKVATIRVRRRQHIQSNQKTSFGVKKSKVTNSLIPDILNQSWNWEDVMEDMLTIIDLGDREQVFGLNLLDTAMWESKENCASTLIEIFKRIYPDAWGSRMEDCFRHSIFALYLLNTQRKPEQQFTILDIVPFITVDEWRKELLNHPVIARDNLAIVGWWQIQFQEKMNDNFRNEVIKPVLNKLNPFIGSDFLSRIFGQPQTTLDFEPLLRRGSIILFDLAASEIETENCALAGAILIGFLLKKARQIADSIPREADRPLVQLMVDEFNVILAAPYADIMGQYRKWGVRATLATQSLALLDQLDPTLKPLVMANAANLMVLQVNAEDADYLRRELVADGTTSSKTASLSEVAGSLISPSAGGGGFGPDLYDLVNAQRGMCYFKGTFDGVRKPVFTVKIAPRPFQSANRGFSQPFINSASPSPSNNQPQSIPLNQESQPEAELARLQIEIEIEHQAILSKVLEKCRNQYCQGAPEITACLNLKHRAYLELYWLKMPQADSCELLSGFTTGLNELVAGLDQRLKVALREKEIASIVSRRRGHGRNKSEITPNLQISTDKEQVSNEEGKGKDDSANLSTLVQTDGTQTREKEEKPINIITLASNQSPELKDTPLPLLPYAPGYSVKPPVRNRVPLLQIFRETRQLPDGEDYRAAYQVDKQRQKDLARKKQEWRRFKEAVEARRQGLQYATQVKAHPPKLPFPQSQTESKAGYSSEEGNNYGLKSDEE